MSDAAVVLVTTQALSPEPFDDENGVEDSDIEPEAREEEENDIDQMSSKCSSESEKEAPEKIENRRLASKRGRVQKSRATNGQLPADQPVSRPNDQHQCNECDKTFTRATHLKRHMTTHSEERPYACSMCDKKFRRADHLSE